MVVRNEHTLYDLVTSFQVFGSKFRCVGTNLFKFIGFNNQSAHDLFEQF